MKKWFILLLTFIITFLITGCNHKRSTELEDVIHNFDYYAEIVEFQQLNEYGSDLKFIVTYNDNYDEVYYIYQVKNIHRDFEVIFKVNDEIIHESFIIRVDKMGGSHTEIVKASDLPLNNLVQKAEIRLNGPGFHLTDVVGVTFKHQFNLIKSKADIASLNREFRVGKDYKEQDIKTIADYQKDIKLKQILVITLATAIITYILVLKIYKILYQKSIENTLKNDRIKFKLLDINLFKYILTILVSISAIITFFLVMNNHSKKINRQNTYIEGYAQQEEVNGNYLNLKLAYTQDYQEMYYTAFIEKSFGNYVGFIYISFDNDEEYQTFVSSSDYGAYPFKVIFRNVSYKTMDIKAYEDRYGTLVYSRSLRLKR